MPSNPRAAAVKIHIAPPGQQIDLSFGLDSQLELRGGQSLDQLSNILKLVIAEGATETLVWKGDRVARSEGRVGDDFTTKSHHVLTRLQRVPSRDEVRVYEPY